VTRVVEVAITVRDLDAALKFYRDALELPQLQELQDGVSLAAGNVRLTLVSHDALPSDSPADCIDLLGLEAERLEAGREEHQVEIQGAAVAVTAPGVVEPIPPLLPSPWVKNIDHIVISSGDSARTAAAFEAELGLELKRKMVRPGTNAQLVFAKPGEVILEFAGPPEPKPGPLTAQFWGMVFNVRNLDRLIERVRDAGLSCGDPRPAVQPGARIASIKAGTGGVPIALIEYDRLPETERASSDPGG
jgi:catechol 2,3-dioxygenase-like lactoylglutathione lyase family enzyme